jgi:hypothetical protein
LFLDNAERMGRRRTRQNCRYATHDLPSRQHPVKGIANSGSRLRSSTKSRLNLDTLDFVKVPRREMEEVLAAFAAHKGEVTEGYVAAAMAGR